MSQFPRSEVEDAFAHFYNLGCVVEDWSGWAELFTDDALLRRALLGRDARTGRDPGVDQSGDGRGP